ncbi:MAG TPA: hypothetical protein VFF65_06160 [Phycisphaerales bacterium]|nr:hypothetical protein [Phycisphaerales bacterium]
MGEKAIRILTVDGDVPLIAQVEYALEYDERFQLVGHLPSDERLCEAVRTRSPRIVLVMLSADTAGSATPGRRSSEVLNAVLNAIGQCPEPRIIAVVEKDTPEIRSLVLDGGAWGLVVKDGAGATFAPTLRATLVAVNEGKVAFL